MNLPKTADVVIIGGGIIGVSTALHLARMGAGQVVLLERKQLAAGATGMSSGLVRMHYDNPLEAEFALKSFDTFRHFDELVGGECGFVRTGFVRTVEPRNRASLRKNVKMLQGLGVNTSLVAGDDVRALAPYMVTDDLPVAAYEPESGYADPHSTTMGLAAAARRYGAKIFQGVEVTGITIEGGRAAGVQTPVGSVSAPAIVNAAGPWGALVAAQAGVDIDLTVILHKAAVIQDPAEMPWPHLTVIDRLNGIYLRPESGRLTLVGASPENSVVGIEQLDSYDTTMPDKMRNQVLERLCKRIPIMERGWPQRGHGGILAKSRDGHALLGEAPGVAGFYCAVGLSGHGFKEAPAIGQAMAELVMHGRAEIVDISPLHLDRFRQGRPYSGTHTYE